MTCTLPLIPRMHSISPELINKSHTGVMRQSRVLLLASANAPLLSPDVGPNSAPLAQQDLQNLVARVLLANVPTNARLSHCASDASVLKLCTNGRIMLARMVDPPSFISPPPNRMLLLSLSLLSLLSLSSCSCCCHCPHSCPCCCCSCCWRCCHCSCCSLQQCFFIHFGLIMRDGMERRESSMALLHFQ